MRLDLSTVLVQWAAGVMLAAWVTTRHRVVGVGYGWLVRGVGLALAVGGLFAGLADDHGGWGMTVRTVGVGAMAVGISWALLVSVRRRHRDLAGPDGFPPRLDLVAGLAGLPALFGAADVVGGPYASSLGRIVVGALFVGLVTDAMLLGHWYLVQPGLSRSPITELTRLVLWIWPVEVALLLVPTGMVSVLNGRIDDGYGGLLAWLWVMSALMTLGLTVAALRALAEPYYSAVMATTGLLYLAILTAFGTDVLARALLAQ